MELSKRDRDRLKGVHPDLIRVVERAAKLTSRPFFIIQGLRTIAEQKRNVARGKSQTMRSRHLTGHAVDIGLYRPDGKTLDWNLDSFGAFNVVMQDASKIEKVPVTWGGSWQTIKDGDHWELPRDKYP